MWFRIVFESDFPEKEIEKEKGVIIEEINMYNDSPGSIVSSNFSNLLYGDQPAGWPVAGLKNNIHKMNRTDFIDYRNRHYVASATTIIISGKINEKEIIQKSLKNFQRCRHMEKRREEKSD